MKIKEARIWTADAVRHVCIKYDLYTRGTCKEYDKILDFVSEKRAPTDNAIYKVAKDIAEHSADQTVENVMFLLSNFAVRRTYEIL